MNRPREGNGESVSRRDFLKTAATAGAGALVGGGAIAREVQRAISQPAQVDRARSPEEKMSYVMEHAGSAYYYCSALRPELVLDSAVLPPWPMISKIAQKNLETYTGRPLADLQKRAAQTLEHCKLYPNLLSSPAFQEVLPALEKELGEYVHASSGLDEKSLALLYASKLDFIRRQIFNSVSRDNIRRDYHVDVRGEQDADIMQADVTILSAQLALVPKFTITEKARLQSVIFVSGDSMPAGAGGNASNRSIHLVAGNEEHAFIHELTHILQQENADGLHRQGPYASADMWKQGVNEGRAYGYANGLEAIKAGSAAWRKRLAEAFPGVFDSKADAEVPGYANEYSWAGEAIEDEATISAGLLSGKILPKLLKRAALGDRIIKRKLEVMSGYALDRPFHCAVREAIPEDELEQRMKYVPAAALQYAKIYESLEHISYGQEVTYSGGPLPMPFKLGDAVYRLAAISKEVKFLAETLLGNRLEVINNFGTKLSDDDYKALGYPGPYYWPVWAKRVEPYSTTPVCRMDAYYFNNIGDGYKDVKFYEDAKGGTVWSAAKVWE